MKKNLTKIVLIAMMLFYGQFTFGQLTAKQHINNHTMLEAMANGYYQIQQEYGLDSLSTINWTGTYSDTGWTGSITGMLYNLNLTINYIGTTTYDNNQNAISTFSATGLNGTH